MEKRQFLRQKNISQNRFYFIIIIQKPIIIDIYNLH